MVSLDDFLASRKAQGLSWPSRQGVYQLIFKDPLFAREVTGRLGRKVFIDPTGFERWLTASARGGKRDAD